MGVYGRRMISAARLRAVFIMITNDSAISKRYPVVKYLRESGTDPAAIREATCDANPEQSCKLIQFNPKITKGKFLEEMQITEE